MIFRPSYCANCGDKIEREEWFLWTSRRFCQVCESEFKGQDLIPRFIIVIGILASVVGFGSYLRNGTGSDPTVTRQTKNGSEPPHASLTANAAKTATTNGNSVASQMNKGTDAIPPAPRSLADMQPSKSIAGVKTDNEIANYYCGAQTKKGTPCTRRVKGNVRCYQHTGMPAMLPPDKLKVG